MPLPDGFVAVQARITGKVQGVWYRAWTEDEAKKRGLKGWVRNRRDGSVEALFVGPEGKVDDMIKACHQGPAAAHVVGVTAEPCAESMPADFHQLPTF